MRLSSDLRSEAKRPSFCELRSHRLTRPGIEPNGTTTHAAGSDQIAFKGYTDEAVVCVAHWKPRLSPHALVGFKTHQVFLGRRARAPLKDEQPTGAVWKINGCVDFSHIGKVIPAGRLFISGQAFDVACWHITKIFCNAKLRRYRGMADIDQAASHSI